MTYNMTMLDSRVIRADFPILQRQVHGHPLVYLDNAATSQKPQLVIDAIIDYYTQHNANVHRGVHTLGDESTRLFHDARQHIAHFFGAQSAELIAVRNTTEAANAVAQSWGRQKLQRGDVIVSSELEHHSNLVPWQRLAAETGAELYLLKVDENGYLDLDELATVLATQPVKLLAVSHVSNALGTLLPLTEVLQLTKQHGVTTFIDGAQAASHLPIHFDAWGVDFYAVSAHKMLGPMGIGGLLVKQSILAQLEPWLVGGGMIDVVSPEKTTYAEDLEERFTAGTPDVAGLVGWAAACRYLQQLGWNEIMSHHRQLVEETMKLLNRFAQVKIVGPLDPLRRVGSVAFLYEGVHAHDVGQVLDSVGVAVRSGHHCTMPLHKKFGWSATVRVSFQVYNTREELEMLELGLQKIAAVFKK